MKKVSKIKSKRLLKGAQTSGLIEVVLNDGQIVYFAKCEDGSVASSEVYKYKINFRILPKNVNLKKQTIVIGEGFAYGKTYEINADNHEIYFNQYIPIINTKTNSVVAYVDWLGYEITDINHSTGYPVTSVYMDYILSHANGISSSRIPHMAFTNNKFYKAVLSAEMKYYDEKVQTLKARNASVIKLALAKKEYNNALEAIRAKRAQALLQERLNKHNVCNHSVV